MRGRGGRRSGEPEGDTLGTALLACMLAALLASSVAMVAAAGTIDIAPKVGDILVFRPGARVPIEWEFPAVTISDQLPVSCNLRPDVMVSAGGSLVVRSASLASACIGFTGRTASTNGEYDCGAVADLLVSRSDLQLLINAVGGPGVSTGPPTGSDSVGGGAA